MLTEKIQKVDKEFKKKLFFIFGGITFIILASLIVFHIFIKEMNILSYTSPEEALGKIRIAFRIVIVCWMLSVLICGVVLMRFSLIMYKSKTFPPPGTKVLKDAEIITGLKVEKIAIIGFIFSIILILSGLIVPYFLNIYIG